MLDVQEVYKRGLSDAEKLTPEERLVYLLLDLETCADMEGWDHFFTSSRMRYYRELLDGLQAASDSDSLGVLQDYERHFYELGVAFEAEAISDFLKGASDDYFDTCHDWRTDYSQFIETRWKKIDNYLIRHGYKIDGY